MSEQFWSESVARYNRVYTSPSKNVWQQRVWQSVYGDEYPEEADPLSFTTLTELARIARELKVAPGQTFADVGCGRGGTGLWVARATGASIVGIDIATTALAHATNRATHFGVADRARFQQGVFEATGLPPESLDGVMSIDTLLFVPDKLAATREIARVLRPGSRFVFTSWDCNGPLRERPPQVNDHRPLLEASGFEVEAYEETPDWERRQRAICEGMVAAREEIASEQGEEAAEREANAWLVQLENLASMDRRILVVARKADR